MPLRAALTREGGLGVLRIDNPPVNAISPETVADLAAAIDAFESDRSLAALTIECAGRTFVAGGDIAVFDDPSFSAAPFNRLLSRIEASDRPVAAALFGTVLGGGLELALACHIRIAHPATKLGLPEITLGLLPGSLGTQRLPRLIGVARASAMISSGKPIDAEEARAAGLVDALADDPVAAARAAALAAARDKTPLRRISQSPVPDPADAAVAALKAEAERRPYLPALAGVAACLDAAAHRPFAEGEAVEAAEFAKLLKSPASRALRHIFFAERAARRIPDLPEGARAREIQAVGVLGAGTMGSGIAMAFANAGFPVTLVDVSETALARGRGVIDKTYATQVSRGRMGEAEAKRRAGLIKGAANLSDLAGVDLVIEAVFEDMALKLEVAAKLGAICKPGAILATNTSTLDVNRIAEASGRPGDCLGTHFFSPAHVMRLLEVVRGARTSAETLQTVMQIAARIGKTAVVSGVCYGFIGNRMAEVYGRENEAMQLEGATPQEIDGVAENPKWLGLAMGPSRMLDMAGVDVGARTVIEWIKSGEGPQAPSYRALCRALFEAGRHGQKTGEGFYRYEGRTALPSDARTALAEKLAAKHGVARRVAIPEQEIFERLLYPMINEAAEILREGIAYRPGDIDVVWTAGYGFPAWRGGPVFMADEIGLKEIVARLEHYAANQTWSVSPLLRELAERGARLSDWRAEGSRRKA
jgi:3-hydroxyacyl-CoA dehydrogenase